MMSVCVSVSRYEKRYDPLKILKSRIVPTEKFEAGKVFSFKDQRPPRVPLSWNSGRGRHVGRREIPK